METPPKTITIHQPDFMPWLGFFHRWAQSDLFIILDDVQFLRRGWHHRDRIMTPNGDKWLTVPVKKKGRYHDHINEIQTEDASCWQRKHLNLIYSAYYKAPMFETIYPELETLYLQPHDGTLMGFNLRLLAFLGKLLKISTPLCLSSSLGSNATSSKRLVELVQATNGTSYLTGLGAKKYLDETLFTKHNISVMWHEFTHPVYPQLHGGTFTPNLSVIDALMNLPTAAVLGFL